MAPVADLDPLFNPRSIAVVGASNKPGKMGNLFIQRLAAGFRGALYAVNPSERDVAGVATYRTVAELPEPIDVLIALVPAAELMTVAEACRKNQVRFLFAIPSGFAETAAKGEEMQQRLAAIARSRGMRLLGPNIVGVMNGVLGLNASMMPELPPGGKGLSCVTQSGGFGMALSIYALDHGLHIAKFCDLGNTADLDVHEVVDYLADDPDTSVVGLFVESIKDRAAFLRAVERAAARKPVLFTPVGVTSAGRRASLAHLGISVSVTPLKTELPVGVLTADTGLELLNGAKALLWQPRSRGPRVAILTGTGGIGAELADLAAAHNLEVPSLSAMLQERLRAHLPYYASVQNPIDCTPIWWDYPKIYPQVLEEIAKSGEVDLAIVSVTDVAATLPELASALGDWARRQPSIPSVLYWGARQKDHANMTVLEHGKIPCYPTTRETVAAAVMLTRR